MDDRTGCFAALIIVAVALGIASWHHSHCDKDIDWVTVVSYKMTDDNSPKYYAVLDDGTTEKLTYSQYRRSEPRVFVYDVTYCDGLEKYRGVNNWLTFGLP